MAESSNLDFGQWLHHTRLSESLDLNVVSRLTGVDIATLSRIENQKVSPLLITVLRICGGLGISREQLMFEMGLVAEQRKKSTIVSNNYGVLEPSIDDIDKFLRAYRENPIRLLDDVCKLFEELFTLLHPNLPPYVQKASWSTPLLLAVTPSFLEIDFLRPPQLTETMILATYQAGRFISMTDVGFVLQQRRSMLGKSLKKGGTVGPSPSMLSRMERGQIDRIKFVDAIALNQTYGVLDDLFGLYWWANQLQDKYVGEIRLPECSSEECKISVYRLVTIYVMIERWLDIVDPKPSSGLWRLPT